MMVDKKKGTYALLLTASSVTVDAKPTNLCLRVMVEEDKQSPSAENTVK
jgi:hypothetical protein